MFNFYSRDAAYLRDEVSKIERKLKVEASPRACSRSAILKRAWTLLSLNRSLEHFSVTSENSAGRAQSTLLGESVNYFRLRSQHCQYGHSLIAIGFRFQISDFSYAKEHEFRVIIILYYIKYI